MGNYAFLRWEAARCYLSRSWDGISDRAKTSARHCRSACIKPSRISPPACGRRAAFRSETRSTSKTSMMRIVHLAKAIETGEEVHFLPVPRDLSERKTCIVSKRTYAVAQKLAKRQNVKISAVALTGFSRYLQKYGPDFYDKIKAAANRKRR